MSYLDLRAGWIAAILDYLNEPCDAIVDPDPDFRICADLWDGGLVTCDEIVVQVALRLGWCTKEQAKTGYDALHAFLMQHPGAEEEIEPDVFLSNCSALEALSDLAGDVCDRLTRDTAGQVTTSLAF